MTDYIIFIPLVIILAGLTPIVIIDKYIGKKEKHTMLCIIVSVALLLVQNVGDYALQLVYMPPPIYRTIFGILGYSLRPLILVLFCMLVQPYRKHIAAWVIVILNALIHSTALYSKIVFYIRPNNSYWGGPLRNTALYISAVLLIYLIGCTVYEYRHRKAGIWVALANVLLIIAGVAADKSFLYRDYPVTYLTIAIVCCTLFYYIWLYLEFVREHENALLAEQRIKIMISQIQPHFLYNTLTTIQSFCLQDPKIAFEITGKFGAYLRNNIDSLEQANLIPIKKELEHTRIYADIEMLRFTEICIEYHIEAEDFFVPALTIQPLVENAIRHGVRDCEHGKIDISTAETAEHYIITVSDNGKGFDIEKPFSSDSTHIGIKNVRERIEEMCGGTMTIESEIGKGTVITICIPRSQK